MVWTATIVVALSGTVHYAGAQNAITPAWSREFAVKLVCGPTPANPPVAAGQYFTAINVHNPSGATAGFRFKVAVTSMPHRELELVPGPVSQFVSGALKPDQAIEIDCQHALALAKTVVSNAAFLKGFLVLQSTSELDVVAVYSASGPTARVQTLALERVPSHALGGR